ncbi:hypothetical protein HW115_09960 [Verrucomicrobiaceae bacterium N1E253]|uniref:Alpha-galactosidase n=1 Tax=Oceaniferula marina TaxID=2748318 RepID=A0A851GLI2_9BACT|nr:hypothetical protein [Oceaniferula marina]NWK55937.1 hypothetical protein [Oceaniferula marina]
MKTINKTALLLYAVLGAGQLMFAAEDKAVDPTVLPLFDEQKVALKSDWLIDNRHAKAGLYQSRSGGLVLSNGLISRSFQIEPNTACISFKNLWSGEEFLRSTEPEARITINGLTMNVGGLEPASQKGFILEKDLPKMKALKGACKLESVHQGPIQAHIAWKANPQWMAEHKDWPPKGREIRFQYHIDDEVLQEVLTFSQDLSIGAEILDACEFTGAVLETRWKAVMSPSLSDSTFTNEGYAGEYTGYENESVFLERALPEGVKLVECRIDPGTDQSGKAVNRHNPGNGLGPGIALIWQKTGKKEEAAKIYSHPSKGVLYAGCKGKYKKIADIDPSTPVVLRAYLDGGQLVCFYSQNDKNWKKVGARIKLPVGAPDLVRVGKTGMHGGVVKADKPGKKMISKIQSFRVYGARKKTDETLAQLGYLKELKINVHYNLYDGLPVMSKWISVQNHGETPCVLNSYVSELLAINNENITTAGGQGWEPAKRFYIESGLFRHGSAESASPGPQAEGSYAVHWMRDPSFRSQPAVTSKALVRVECSPPIGPEETLDPDEVFVSHRIWELPFDSHDQERQQLAKSQMYRNLAPWTTECPLEYDITSSKEEHVKKGIDQCADVGYELMLMSFGSGFNCEDVSPANIAKYKRLEAYAKQKGITIGGYNLLASRGAGKDSCIDPATGKTSGPHCRFGRCPCLASNWGMNYLKNIKTFYQKTGMGLFTHDGSYPTDPCGADYHPGHKGYKDSVWQQRKRILDFYSWMNGQGIFLRIPDWYVMYGASKVQHNYREASWSAPREMQHLLTRRTIYDSSLHSRNNIMGWTFVPLSNYKGGGKAAAMIPLKQNLADYEHRLACTLGYGVTSMMRGPQLYDSPETLAMLKKMVAFFKRHRAILTSDILHLKRPDGRSLDYILHVNPKLEEKGLMMVYNPLERDVEQEIRVPLYYTGIRGEAMIQEQESAEKQQHSLNDRNEVTVKVKVKAKGYTWYVFKDAND